MASIPWQKEIDYPESDGRPMGETEDHINEIVDLVAALRQRFLDAADVYVGADLLLYFVEGNPARCVCPDVLVTVGIPRAPARRSYFLWKEGRPPSMVIEVTSEGSRREDVEKKRIYAEIGVEEYFLDDPLGDYLKPALQGFRLVKGRYEPIEPDAQGRLLSRTTGLLLRREGQRVRLSDARTGEPLLGMDELIRERRAAEEEIARLRRELETR